MRAPVLTLLVCAAFAVAGAGGCKGEDRCAFIGDPALPAEVKLTELRLGAGVDLSDGSTLSLERPPQGGYVVYVGVRARNVSSCDVSLEGKLLDPSSGEQHGRDRRLSNFEVGTDGWGRPGAPLSASYPNVNACPDVLTTGVEGATLALEITLTDAENRVATARMAVVPTCQQSDPAERASCVCTCSANYVPGKCTAHDLGPD